MNFMQGQRLAQILLSVGGLLTTTGCLLTEMTQTSQCHKMQKIGTAISWGVIT